MPIGIRDGTLRGSIHGAFDQLNIDYASGMSKNTPKKMLQQYDFLHDGTVYSCYEHLKHGGTHDPAACLRVYFTTKQRIDGKIVVGHVGRHLDVTSTA